MKIHRRDGLALLAFAAMALLCFGRLTLSPGSLIVDPDRPAVDVRTRLEVPTVGNDLSRLFLPHHLWIGRRVRELGRLPLWDDRGFGGRPLVGNPQAGVFYPPVWLAWWSGSPAALGWLTVGHVVWLALGTYGLASTLGLGFRFSLFAGLCVQVLPFVLGHVFAGHLPHVWAVSWYPWVYEAAVRARRGLRSGWLALPPLLALCFVAGHPQEWYLLVLGLGAVALRDMSVRWNLRRGFAWAGTVGLSLGLVGLELVPILEARGWTGGKTGATLALADRHHLGLANLLQWASPNALGDPANYVGPGNWWETQASVGLVVGGLVLVAGFGPRRWPLVRVMLAAVLMCGVFAAGRSLGLFAVLFYGLPGMGEFRAPARALFLAQPLIAVLAAVGLETVCRRGGRRWAAVLGCLALAELSVYGVDLIRVAPAERFLSAGPIDGVLGGDTLSRVRARDWFYEDAMAANLGLAKTNVGDGFQIRHATELIERLYPMFHPAWDVRGEPMDDAVEAVRRMDRQAILDRLAVGWLVDEGGPDPSVPWEPVATGPWRGTDYTVYRNRTALPRAYVVPGAVVDGDSRRIRLHDPRLVVMMEADPLADVDGPRQAFRPAEIDASDPDRVTIRVRTEAPGLLVVADTWMPGWSATVDGAPAEILRGNTAQRVVVIKESGEHVIEMVYRTPGLDAGMAMSAASLLVWGWLAMRIGRVGCGRGRTGRVNPTDASG